jgi:hypothetical protein
MGWLDAINTFIDLPDIGSQVMASQIDDFFNRDY